MGKRSTSSTTSLSISSSSSSKRSLSSSCCEKEGIKRGLWTPEEDEILINYINSNTHSTWRSLPKLAGLLRCGKSCRLRWTNYLRPDIKRGRFTSEEEKLVIQLHAILGNRWAAIASQIPGRTDNEVKNLWNTHLKKQLISNGIDPQSHQPITTGGYVPSTSPTTRHMAQWESARMEAEARLSRETQLFTHNQNNNNGNNSNDYFLQMWNSKVGESFRKVGGSNDEKAMMMDGWDSSSSSEIEDESECGAMDLLLDFPDNDMSFLEDNSESSSRKC